MLKVEDVEVVEKVFVVMGGIVVKLEEFLLIIIDGEEIIIKD